jgi:hydroxypyruvate isomerase
MARIRQSVVLGRFTRNTGYEPETVISEAAALGIQGVELVQPQWWPAVKAAGMKVVGIGGHGSFTDGLNRRENHDRIEGELRRNIEIAAANDIRNLICLSGSRAGVSDAEGIENSAAGLLRVIKVAEQAGVVLMIELCNSKIDHPGYQADHTAWGVEVCKRVNSPFCKLLYDIYHMQIMEGDIIRTVTQNIGHIGHFHIAGNPGRNNIDDTQELNYVAIMKAIAATGFDGYVGHEYTPVGDAMKVLRDTYKMIDVS